VVNWQQLSILSERYLEIVLGDRGNTFLLLIQAPIIAFFIILVWKDYQSPTNTLYFVMALAAVWFGCINSCREIVKERAIFAREARVGLSPTSYVLSKFMILMILGMIQCLFLVFPVNLWVPLPGSTLFHYGYMVLASLGGTALGLFLSCLMTTSERAVASVPIFVLPQILLSDQIVSHEHSTKLIKWLDDLTLTSWAFDGMREVTKSEPSLFNLGEYALALSCMTVVLLALANLIVTWRARRPGALA
jgi:ABC-type multidrug transport system permease subunit